MNAETLAQALEREHHEIDAGIEEFLANRSKGGDQSEPLKRAQDALRRHIYLEEEFVFPPLHDAGLMMPIYVMLREHREIWETMDALDAQLACRPAQRVSDELCRDLLTQLERHNSKEEAIIYPQADVELDPALDAQLRQFLADGDMPQGWRPAEQRTHHQ